MATQSRIERISVRLPDGFDPAKHQQALERKITEIHGSGWEVTNINPNDNTAWAERHITISEIQESTAGSEVIDVRLPRNTKPSDGEKMAAKLEDQYPGYTLTAWEPYLSYATLTKLSAPAIRARGAIANALGVKPWDIQIQEELDGGFSHSLPKNFVPSRHEAKLQEVAESIVGREGWYSATNPQKLTGRLVPADPPTFPASIPYPFKQKIPAYTPTGDWFKIPIGERLPEQGAERGEQLLTDFSANPMMQISGITGGGKGVLLTSIAAGALARGWELGLVDAVKGGVDFVDLIPFCKPGYFGEDLAQACTVVARAYEEGQRRKKLIKEHKVQKFTQLPASLGLKPLMIIVDEATSLLLTDTVPKGIDKNSTLAMEISERSLQAGTVLSWLGKIARELRFSGVSLILSTQVASATVGIPTELRANLGAKFLLGASPTPNNRRLALSAPDSVPEVPRNIAIDENGAARGVGVFEREGSKPGVFKAFFSPPPDFAKWLRSMGLPETDRPNPTPTEIARYTPSIESDIDEPRSRMAPEQGGYGRNEQYSRRDDGLGGAAAAAHDLRVAENQMKAAAKRQLADDLQ